ncbi:MAG TPA: ATP-binding protein, partial [Polyangiaceae bacterium]
TVRVHDETVAISVADTGVGIGPEQFERIFLPFERAKEGYEARQQGTGLGLPIARRLAVLHGGSLEVQSDVGAGSVFTLEIPRRLADVQTISTSPPRR